MSAPDRSKREFIKKAAYAAPAVITLSVLPAHRAHGSTRQGGGSGSGGGSGGQPNRPWWWWIVNLFR